MRRQLCLLLRLIMAERKTVVSGDVTLLALLLLLVLRPATISHGGEDARD